MAVFSIFTHILKIFFPNPQNNCSVLTTLVDFQLNVPLFFPVLSIMDEYCNNTYNCILAIGIDCSNKLRLWNNAHVLSCQLGSKQSSVGSYAAILKQKNSMFIMHWGVFVTRRYGGKKPKYIVLNNAPLIDKQAETGGGGSHQSDDWEGKWIGTSYEHQCLFSRVANGTSHWILVTSRVILLLKVSTHAFYYNTMLNGHHLNSCKIGLQR